MIITVDELKKFITTDIADEELKTRLSALETAIRKYTNNLFNVRGCTSQAKIKDGKIILESPINLKVGDSIFIYSYSYEDKVVTITDINELKLTINEELRVDEPVSIGLIQYPNDIKMGVVNLIKWDISNREKVGVKSETISRWSVTYFDLENNSLLGYPSSLLGFLKPYKRVRF